MLPASMPMVPAVIVALAALTDPVTAMPPAFTMSKLPPFPTVKVPSVPMALAWPRVTLPPALPVSMPVPIVPAVWPIVPVVATRLTSVPLLTLAPSAMLVACSVMSVPADTALLIASAAPEFSDSASATVMAPPSAIVPPVTLRLASGLVPPTAPANVTVPVPALTVRLSVPAVASSTVLPNSTVLFVVVMYAAAADRHRIVESLRT